MPSRKESDNNKTIIWIVVAVIVAIVIGVIIYFVMHHKKESYVPIYSEENYQEVTRLHEEVVKKVAQEIAEEKEKVEKHIQEATDFVQNQVGVAIEKAHKFMEAVHHILLRHKTTMKPHENNKEHENNNHEHITKKPSHHQHEILEDIKHAAKIINIGEHFDTEDILKNLHNIRKFVNKVEDAFKTHGKKGEFLLVAKSLHDDFKDELKSKIQEVEEKLKTVQEREEKIKKQEVIVSTGAPHQVMLLKEVLAKKEENTKKFLKRMKEILEEKKDKKLSEEDIKKEIEGAAKKHLEAPQHVAKHVSSELSDDKKFENFVNGVTSLEDYLPEFFIENYGWWDKVKSIGKSALNTAVNLSKDKMVSTAISWVIKETGIINMINNRTGDYFQIIGNILKVYSKKAKEWFFNQVDDLTKKISGTVKLGFDALVNLAKTKWNTVFDFLVKELNNFTKDLPGINKVEGVKDTTEDYEDPEEYEYRKKVKDLDEQCVVSHVKKMIKNCHKDIEKKKKEERENYENENDHEHGKSRVPSKEEKERGERIIKVLEDILSKKKVEHLRKLLGHHINNKHVLDMICEIADDKKLVDAVRLIRDHNEANEKRREEKRKKEEDYENYYYDY